MKTKNSVRNHLLDKIVLDNVLTTKSRFIKSFFENDFGKKQPKHFSLNGRS
jgi:hypothetical protein